MQPQQPFENYVDAPEGRESRWMLPAAWVTTVLALLGSASGSGGKLEGFLLAAALNPLSWLAFYWFYRHNKIRCPHCRLTADDTFMLKLPLGGTVRCGRCKHFFRKPGAGQVVLPQSTTPHNVTNVGITITPTSTTSNAELNNPQDTRLTTTIESYRTKSSGDDSLREAASTTLEASPTASTPVQSDSEATSSVVEVPSIVDVASLSTASAVDSAIDELRGELRAARRSISAIRRSLVVVVAFQTILITAIIVYALATFNYRRARSTPTGTVTSESKPHNLRRWTDSRGRVILARLISVADDYAVLQKEDGRQFRISIAKFSENDQAYLVQHAQPSSE